MEWVILALFMLRVSQVLNWLYGSCGCTARLVLLHKLVVLLLYALKSCMDE